MPNLIYDAKCLICGCQESEVKKMHYFPTNLERSRLWQESLGMPFRGESLSSRRICSRHFEDICYLDNSTCKLRRDALPTNFFQLLNSSPYLVNDTVVKVEVVEESPKPNNIKSDVFAPPENLEKLSENDIEKATSPILADQCRTCLNTVDKNTSKRITDICLLDKSIKDVIVFLVPELDSKLNDDELLCKDCIAVLESTLKFIVKCLEVESALDKCREDVTVDTAEHFANKEDRENEVQIKTEKDPLESLEVEHDYCVKIVSADDFHIPNESGDQNDVKSEYDSLALAAEMVEQSLLDYCQENDDAATANSSNVASPNSFICEVCGKGFDEQGSLRSHLKTHESNESFMCDKCSKMFKNQRLLDVHIKYVHNKFYGSQCNVCGILCKTPANVKTHMRVVHFKEKPYQCDICHRRFGRSDYLHNHKLRHTVESGRRRTKMGFKIIDPGEPVPCKFCGQWYKDLLRLKRHLETHLKRYSCQFCSLTFPRNILRLKHEEMHRGGTVTFFRCNVCWKKYKTKEALDEHAACHNNPQHFCDLCGQTFNRKYLLSQHKMTEHSSIPDKEQPEEIIYDSLLEVGALPT